MKSTASTAGHRASLSRLGVAAIVVSAASGHVAMAEGPPDRLWLAEWNGPGNHSDDAIAALTLPDRSVLIAGRTFNLAPPSGDRPMLLRYGADGDLLWSIVEPTFARPSSLHRTSTGDVLLCGHDFIDGQWNVFIRRLDPSDGSTIWQTARPATLGFGLFKPAVVEDATTQSVLVAAARGGDALVVRLSLADGSLLDEDLFDGPRGGDDIATGIAALPGGGFVVASTQQGLSDGYRTFAVGADGSVLWEDHEGGAIGNVFTPAWLGLDQQGNVLVGGGPETTCGLFQFRAWKISPTGRRLWTVEWPTAFCKSAEPADFAVAPDGSIAMVGQTHNPFDMAVLHVDPDGEAWVRTWNSPVGGIDDAVVVECDAGGNVILGGFAAASPGQDLALIAYTSDGDELFTRLDSAGLSGTESIRDLSLGQGTASGTIGIVADGFTPSQNQNVYTALYERDLPPGDLDGDGVVGPADLALLLSAWGPCGPACPADLDDDGAVGAADLGVLLSQWTFDLMVDM